jgi:hypothetical protein
MNRMLRFGKVWLACLLAGALSVGLALAESASAAPVAEIVLVGTFPRDAQLVIDESDAEGNYYQALMSSDGAFILSTLRQRISDVYPLEMPVADFLQRYFDLERAPALEAVPTEPVAAYPTERVRFESGENEDSPVEDVVVIRTDEYYFAFIAHTSADIYYGYSQDYAEGDAAQMFDIWAESLDLFDSSETTGGE